MLDPDREASLRRAIEELYFGYRAFTALPDKMLAQRGLGRTHHRVLYFVRRDPGISIGELLAVLEVTKQAIHRPIKDLEERGLLIDRRRPPGPQGPAPLGDSRRGGVRGATDGFPDAAA